MSTGALSHKIKPISEDKGLFMSTRETTENPGEKLKSDLYKSKSLANLKNRSILPVGGRIVII